MRVLFLFFSLFFLEVLVLCVLHVLSQKISETKTILEVSILEEHEKILRLNQSNQYENIQTNQPVKPIWNQNQIRPIKSIWNQNQIKPIKRIYPSNPPPINPSTTIEFPNQETKTLVLHKTKLHGRKREEAPPRAYQRQGEREWFRSRDHAPHLFFQLVLGTPSHWASKT